MDVKNFEPYERICAGPPTDVILVCDHASNAVPPGISLGVSPEDMARHIAYDVGARGVTLELAERLGAQALMTTYSRLVIDPNRAERDPTLIMKIYDGSIIPGNRHVDAAERERRLRAYYRPYHVMLDQTIDEVLARGGVPMLISIHSYTPQLRGKAPRPWHIGLLWDRDDRLLRPLLRELSRQDGLIVGNNKPYTGELPGDCMATHGTCRGVAHILIEVRNDLITTPEGQKIWAERLEEPLRIAVDEVRLAASA